MDLMKVTIKVLNYDAAVISLLPRFGTQSDYKSMTCIMTDPHWSWHPCFPWNKYMYMPYNHEAHTVECIGGRAVTNIPTPFPIFDDDEIMLDEDRLHYFFNSSGLSNRLDPLPGYRVWTTSDKDILIERVFPNSKLSVYDPIYVDGNPTYDWKTANIWYNHDKARV